MNSTWKRNSKGHQSWVDKLLSSFLVSMCAIYFRELRMSAAIAFKGSPGVCGHAVNSYILLFSSYSGSIGIAAEENGYNVTFYLKPIPLLVIMVMCDPLRSWDKEKKTQLSTAVFFFVISCWLSLLSHWNSYLSLWNRKLRIFTKGLITMLRHNWHSYKWKDRFTRRTTKLPLFSILSCP